MISGRSYPIRHPRPRPMAVETVTVTCCIDDRAHEVREADLAVALTRSDGYYQALCGHVVTAAPMVMPDGRPCHPCAVVQDRDVISRRHSLLQRALG